MKQMDRRLLILMRLREGRPVRAADLAAACECSVRTVYRDIDALCRAGVPVAALPGEGYRLAPGYHLPPIAFTMEEAVQLLLGVDLASGLGTASQREAARTAAAKVEAVLSPETRAEVERLRQRIRISRWARRDASPWLPLLQQAVVEDRLVRIRYHAFATDQVTQREVEPHFLVYYGNDWHLVAYCRLRGGMRDFRLGRVLDAALLPEGFRRRHDADPEGEEGAPSQAREVRVWVAERAVPWAREAPAFGLERVEPVEDGAVFVYRCRDLRRLLPWVLSRGAAAGVLSPPDVAEAVRREAEALATRYAED
ncbi:MAG TPA: YafY family protein [Dehalococcoidia bacterium]